MSDYERGLERVRDELQAELERLQDNKRVLAKAAADAEARDAAAIECLRTDVNKLISEKMELHRELDRLQADKDARTPYEQSNMELRAEVERLRALLAEIERTKPQRYRTSQCRVMGNP